VIGPVLWALIAMQGPSASAPAAEAPQSQSAVQPEPSLMLAQVVNPARMIGTPRICTEPDENGEIPICFMELYEADMLVLRQWSGPPIPRRVRIRFTAHSFHAVWRRDVRFILRTQPFTDQGLSGHFAFYWDWEDDRGRFCEGTEDLSRPEYESLRPIYAHGRRITVQRDNAEDNAGAQITCITGRERARSNG
jgi:hypothetical protein